MKLEIGRIYHNKTLSFLVPALRYYGSTFKDKLNGVQKLAFGIHDTLLDGTPYEDQRLIYILLDSYVKHDVFKSFMSWIKLQEYYVTDYTFDADSVRRHMVVIAFPEVLGDVYDKFILGKYSQMYVFSEIEKYFPSDDSLVKDILIKSVRARNLFADKVYAEFQVRLEPADLKGKGIEYEFPPDKKEEVFNYREPEEQ